MVTRSLLYILPLPFFAVLIANDKGWFSTLAICIGLVYYLNLENQNKKYLRLTSVLTFLIPVSNHLNTDFYQTVSTDFLLFLSYGLVAYVTFLFILRIDKNESNWITRLLGPVGILIFGILTIPQPDGPYFWVGLVILGICYFVKKILTSEHPTFFRNWTITLLSLGVVFLMLYSIITNEQIMEVQVEKQELREQCEELATEKYDSETREIELKEQLENCRNENEETGS
ncbi:MAG: hypothetical protein RIF34_01595 [Candidatus Kapaibacterium sp.]